MSLTNDTTIAEQVQASSDPRSQRGPSYEWQSLFIIGASAVLAGHRSLRTRAQWAAAQAPVRLACLQPQRQRIPSVAPLQRMLTKVPIAELERRMRADTSQLDQEEAPVGSIQTKQGEVLCGQSVDGKPLRGASQPGEVLQLVSLVRHARGVALAQERVASKIDERTAARQMLDPEALAQPVTTSDAL
jgi:hypothetical protein